MRNPLRKHWTVALVGAESGNRTRVTFMRFWRRQDAEEWVELQEHLPGAVLNHLVHYEVEAR